MNAIYSAALIVLAFIGVGCGDAGGRSKSAYATLPPVEASRALAADTSIVALDVRTREEFVGETGHLDKALLIPVQELEGRIGELERYRGRRLFVYCRSGNRSRPASELLAARGFDVTMIDGGIIAWADAGLPVVREGAL